MAELIINRAGDQPRRYVLESDSVLVGSDPSSDLVLDSRFVSRRHARFIRKGRTYEIRDEGSLNGSFVNGKKVDRVHRLNHRDEVVIADFFLTFWTAPERHRTELFDARLPAKLVVDAGAREVWIGPVKVETRFSVQEFSLLSFLYEHKGRFCSRSEIGDHIWGTDVLGGRALPKYDDNMIYRLVSRLKSKLEAFPDGSRYITNMPGAGYRLDDQ